MPLKNAVIVMAAGAGTRFKSKTSKLLHDFAGRPTISYLAKTLSGLKDTQVIFVVSYQKEKIIELLNKDNSFLFVEQKELDGTAGAVRVALPYIDKNVSKIAVVPGDTPLIPFKLISSILDDKADLCVVGCSLDNPSGYGRIKSTNDKKVKAIIEETDLAPKDKKIKVVNTSIYSFKKEFLEKALSKITINKKKKEFYLTDVVGIAVNMKKKINCVRFDDANIVLGANDRLGFLSLAKEVWKKRAIDHINNGVTIIDPINTYIDEVCSIGVDTCIYPNSFITGDSKIEEDVIILEGCRINNTTIKKGSIVGPYVYTDGAEIGTNNKIGPFTYVRPGTKTADKVKIGGFVETKKTVVGAGSKIPHLSYVGDAFIGENVNIGCGVITCNYDGFKKSVTNVGDNAFVGSDCQLIAPVNIAKNSYVAAGTTVTKDVPEDALALSRTPQKHIDGYVKRVREKNSKK